MMPNANSLGENLRSLAFTWADSDYLAPRGKFKINSGWVLSTDMPSETIMRKFMGKAYDEPAILASVQHYHSEILGTSVLWFRDRDCHLMFNTDRYFLVNNDARNSLTWQFYENFWLKQDK